MKRTIRMTIALLAVLSIQLSLVACGGQGKSDNIVLQGIFDRFTVNTEYADWKAMFPSTRFKERLNNDSIVIRARGKEGVNGDYVFTLDGDYLVNTAEAEDYTSYTLLMYLRDALAGYYGMDSMLMSGYLAGMNDFGRENRYFITETEGDKTVIMLYIGGAWDMEGLDEMYVNDAALEYYDALNEEMTACYVNAGKITAAAIGSADQLDILVGEYGGNTELTYRSLMNIVGKLQPKGYEAFAENYTGLAEGSGDGYTVRFGAAEEVLAAHSYVPAEGYSYVTVTFSTGEAAG